MNSPHNLNPVADTMGKHVAAGFRASNFMPYEERAALGEAKVTLDGKPARISGFRLAFAIVRSQDGKWEGEWAWKSAKHVVENCGGGIQTVGIAPAPGGAGVRLPSGRVAIPQLTQHSNR